MLVGFASYINRWICIKSLEHGKKETLEEDRKGSKNK